MVIIPSKYVTKCKWPAFALHFLTSEDSKALYTTLRLSPSDGGETDRGEAVTYLRHQF